MTSSIPPETGMLPMKGTQRGSAQTIVLVVTILILLAFVVMWFMAKDEMTKAVQEKDEAVIEREAAILAKNVTAEGWRELSEKVGWQRALAEERIAVPAATPENSREVLIAQKAKQQITGVSVTRIADLEGNLKPDGTVPAATEGQPAVPGFLNWFRNEGFVEIEQQVRTGKAENVEAKPANLDWMTPEFKQKLTEVEALRVAVPPVPPPPADEDDEAAKAEYAAKLAEFEAAVKRYNDGVQALTTMPPFKRWERMIRAQPGYAITDASQLVKLEFFKEPPAGVHRVQDILEYAKAPFLGLKNEFVNEKKADIAKMNEVTTEKNSLETSLTEIRAQLEAEQGRHTTDVANLNAQLEEANRKVEANRLEATNTRQELEKAQQESATRIGGLEREVAAREERIRLDKAKRDLEIRRNDADGMILSASTGMATATINLGSADKVFAGLKFDVMQVGRGGLREPKGQVMVVRVLGPHSAQVSIVQETAGQPIGQGDSIHNPFYSPTEEIHVWFAGPIEKWPKAIAVARLGRMGVVVDSALSGQTDYVVIPNSMSAPPPPTEGGEEEGPAPGASELDRLRAQAREFGATVITEETLSRFLDF